MVASATRHSIPRSLTLCLLASEWAQPLRVCIWNEKDFDRHERTLFIEEAHFTHAMIIWVQIHYPPRFYIHLFHSRKRSIGERLQDGRNGEAGNVSVLLIPRHVLW
jgi:hypothetical protein